MSDYIPDDNEASLLLESVGNETDAGRKAQMMGMLSRYRDAKASKGEKPFELSDAARFEQRRRTDSLFDGLDKMETQLEPGQREAFKFAVESASDRNEAKARMANQVWVMQRFPQMAGAVDADWTTVKHHVARELWGDEANDLADTAFYGRVGAHIKKEKAETEMMADVLGKVKMAAAKGETDWLKAWVEASQPMGEGSILVNPAYNRANHDRYRQLAQKEFQATVEATSGMRAAISAGQEYYKLAADPRMMQSGAVGEQGVKDLKALSESADAARDHFVEELMRLPPAQAEQALNFAIAGAVDVASQTMGEGGDANAAKKGAVSLERALGEFPKSVGRFVGQAASAAAEMTNLVRATYESDEGRAASLKGVAYEQEYQRRLDMGRKVMQGLNDAVDPIRSKSRIVQGVYDSMQSLPYMLAAATEAGIPLTLAAMAEDNRAKFVDAGVPAQEAVTLALAAAAPQVAIERLQADMVFKGKLPGFEKWLEKPVGGKLELAQKLLATAGLETLHENFEEAAQDITPAIYQAMGSALSESVPEVKWMGPDGELSQYARGRVDTFFALLPMVMVGTGMASFREAHYARQYFSNETALKAVGFTPEASAEIAKAAASGEVEKAQNMVQAGWDDPKMRPRAEVEKESAESAKDINALGAFNSEEQKRAFEQMDADMQASFREAANPVGARAFRNEDGSWTVLDREGHVVDIAMNADHAMQLVRDVDRADAANMTGVIDEMIDFFKQRGRGGPIEITREARTLAHEVEDGNMEADTAQALVNLYVELGALPAGTTVDEARIYGESARRYNAQRQVYEYVSRLHDGADPLVLVEEEAEGYFKSALDAGQFSLEQVEDWRAKVEGKPVKVKDDAAMRRREAVEWFSNYAKAYITGKTQNNEAIPFTFRRWMDKMREVFAQVFQLARDLMEKEARGELPDEFKTHLARAVGLDDEFIARREREQELAQMKKEDRKRYSVREALQAIKLPTPNREAAGWSGELQNLWQSLKFNERMALFGAHDKSLDQVAELLREDYGFSQVQTADDVVRLAEDAFLAGKDALSDQESTMAVRKKGDQTGDLFGELPFNLAGEEAKDHEGVTDRQAEANDARQAQEKAQGDLFDTERAKGAASRFKPSQPVEFKPTVKGPSGAELTGYAWAWRPEAYVDKTGEDRTRRISDWERASESTETGRDIVHQFTVKMPDGDLRDVSAESAMQLLGFVTPEQRAGAKSVVNVAKSLAKAEMKLAVLKERRALNDEAKAKAAALELPEIQDAGMAFPNSPTSKARKWTMGDVMAIAQDGQFDEGRRNFLESSWREKRAEEFGYVSSHESLNDAERRVKQLKQKLEQAAQIADSRAQPVEENAPRKTLNDGTTIVGPTTFAIRAFHGTPHTVDKFSTEKVGTGEGAQAFGWGLYFAGNKGVAEYYHRALKDNFVNREVLEKYFQPGAKVSSWGGATDEVVSFHWNDGNWSVRVRGEDGRVREHSTYPTTRQLDAAGIERGNLYGVELAPDESDLLDWDKPLNDQKGIQARLREAYEQARVEYRKNPEDVRAIDLVANLRIILDELDRSGKSVYRSLSSAMGANPKAASEMLARIGIPGLRFLDQASRAMVSPKYSVKWTDDGLKAEVIERDTGKSMGVFNTFQEADAWVGAQVEAPTHNYVIFDDKLVRIIERNGERVQSDGESTFALKRDGEVPADPNDYMTITQSNAALRAQYVQDGKVVANSRFTPSGIENPPLGAWRIDSFNGLHGHEIEQLRRVPVKDLLLSEEDWSDDKTPNMEGRGDDAKRYADWLREGRTPPPIEVVETDSGKLKVVNGHRRVGAHKRAGVDMIVAWVSPAMDHPHGLRDANGNVLRVGMTYEGMTGREWDANRGERLVKNDDGSVTLGRTTFALRPLPVHPDVITEFFDKIGDDKAENEKLGAEWGAKKDAFEQDLAKWTEEAPKAFGWQFAFPHQKGITHLAVVSPEPSEPGKWRVSYFDKGVYEPRDQWFAFSHATRDTKLDAVKEAISFGATQARNNPRLIDDVNSTFALRAQTSTPEFKRWFGDWESAPEKASKVVDENGEPRVVYHGTNADLREFKAPAFFSIFPEDTEFYSTRMGEEGGNTYPVFLDIKNPLDASTREGAQELVRLAQRAGVDIEIVDFADGSWDVEGDTNGNTNDLLYSEAVREQMKREGYDGLHASDVLLNSETEIWIPLEASQIKSAIGNRGTFDASNPDITFSLNKANNGDLIAVHNTNAKKLAMMDELGGIAAPSVAIVKHGTSQFDSFGDISLVAAKSLVDPRVSKKSKAFNADVYSPRFPNMSFKVDTRGLRDAYKMLAKESAVLGHVLTTELDHDEIQRNGWKEIEDSGAVMMKFLRERGMNPEPVMKPVGELPESLRKFTGSKWEIADNLDFKKAVADVILRETEDAKDLREHLLNEDGSAPDGTVNDYARKLELLQRPEVDRSLSRLAFRDAIDKAGLRDEFSAWVKKTFGRVISGKYISDYNEDTGNVRKRPYDLDTVVSIMKRELRDGEGFNYGVWSIRSTVAKQFSSLRGMKDAAGQIVTRAEMEKVKQEANDEFVKLTQELAPYYRYDATRFGYLDQASQSFKELGQKGIRAWEENFKDTPPELLQKVRDFMEKLANAPTEYFEVKVQRGVMLNEMVGAVIPHDASEQTRAILAKHGVSAVEYQRGDAASRAEAIRGFPDQSWAIGTAKRADDVREAMRPRMIGIRVQASENFADAVKELVGRPEYQVRGMSVNEREARKLMEEHANDLGKLKAFLFDPNQSLHPATKVALAFFTAEAANKVGDYATAAEVAKQAAMEATSLGQGVNELKRWSVFSNPETAQRLLQGEIEKENARRRDREPGAQAVADVYAEVQKEARKLLNKWLDEINGVSGDASEEFEQTEIAALPEVTFSLSREVMESGLIPMVAKMLKTRGADATERALIQRYGQGVADQIPEIFIQAQRTLTPKRTEAKKRKGAKQPRLSDDAIERTLGQFRGKREEQTALPTFEELKARGMSDEEIERTLEQFRNRSETQGDLIPEDQPAPRMTPEQIEASMAEGGASGTQGMIDMPELYDRALEHIMGRIKERVEGQKNLPVPKGIKEQIGEVLNRHGLQATEQDVKHIIGARQMIPDMTPAQAEILANFAKRIASTPLDSYERGQQTMHLFSYVYEQLQPYDMIDVAFGLWYANVLSSVITSARNVAGNASMLFLDTAADSIFRNPAQYWPYVQNLAASVQAGAEGSGAQAENTMKRGQEGLHRARTIDDERRLGVMESDTAPAARLRSISRVATRFLSVQDMFFATTAYEMKARQVAWDQAQADVRSGKLKPEQVEDRVARLLNEATDQIQTFKDRAAREWENLLPEVQADYDRENWEKRRVTELRMFERDKALVSRALDFAQKVTLDYEPEGVLGLLLGNLSKTFTMLEKGAQDIQNPAARMVGKGAAKYARTTILPFMRIPVNIFNRALDYGPVGYARALMDAGGVPVLLANGKTRVRNADERADLLKRATLGTLAMVPLMILARPPSPDDEPEEYPWLQIHGAGSGNPQANIALNGPKYRPYSLEVRTGDKQVFIDFRMFPLAPYLAAIGALHDRTRYKKQMDDKSALAQSWILAQAMKEAFMSSSPITSLRELSEAAAESQPMSERAINRTLARATTGKVANLIPLSGLWRSLDQLVGGDRNTRDTLLAANMAEIPVASRLNAPSVDALGDTLKARTGINWLADWQSLSTPEARIYYTFAEKDVTPTDISRYQHKLSVEDYYRFAQRRGAILKELLLTTGEDGVMNVDRLRGLSDKPRQKDEASVARKYLNSLSRVATRRALAELKISVPVEVEPD